MPHVTYPTEPGGPPRVLLRWGFGWKDFEVFLDGQKVGGLPDRPSLERGVALTLPDGQRLEIRLRPSLFGGELWVTRDGKPLPGSDPVGGKVRMAILILFGLGLLFTLSALGAAKTLPKNELPKVVGANFAASFAFGVSGLLALRRIRWSLLLGFAVYAVHLGLTLALAIRLGQLPPFILIQLLLLTLVGRGARALWTAERRTPG